MKDFIKGKLFTVITVVVTLVLAGVAIFTAVRLYQLRTQPVAPTAPESQPEASEPSLIACTQLQFSIAEASISETPEDEEPTLTITSTVTPTPTDTSSDDGEEDGDNDDNNNDNDGDSATDDDDTSVGGSDSAVTPTTRQLAQVSPTPGGLTLPDAGISTPTLFGLILGLLTITAALLLAI